MFNELFKNMNFKDDLERDRFEELYELFMSDLPKNFYLNQYELTNKYLETEVYEWTKMLKHKPFMAWIKEETNIIFDIKVNKALSGKEKDSAHILKIKKDIMQETNKGDKETYIVMDKSLLYDKKIKEKKGDDSDE